MDTLYNRVAGLTVSHKCLLPRRKNNYTACGSPPVELNKQLMVPSDAPPSFTAEPNRIEWEVSAKIEIAAYPDLEERKSLLVGP